MNCREAPEKATDKKFAEIFQDLESPQGFMYVITKSEIYEYDPKTLVSFLKKYARKIKKTDEIGIPHQFSGEEPSDDWVRWQNRSDL